MARSQHTEAAKKQFVLRYHPDRQFFPNVLFSYCRTWQQKCLHVPALKGVDKMSRANVISNEQHKKAIIRVNID